MSEPTSGGSVEIANTSTSTYANAADRYLRPGTLQLGAPPPLSVYVHLPWCLKKCPYCDFNSHELTASRTTRIDASALGLPKLAAAQDALPEARYLDALRADLEASLPLVWGRAVHSVFIGGGTPSLFSPDGIARLLSDIRALLPLLPGAEVTMEANPGTFEKDRFRAYRAAGVTRLSIGVQSFDDAKLQALGRVHDGAQARAAVAEAAASFDTFNLDLMYALPGQSLAELDQDLATALSFSPPHLSLYHLTLEPNTLFALHPPVLPDDDTSADMLDRVVEVTGGAGLQRYEVSAYARPGHRSVHNLNYWQFGDYLGLGAGAHGKLSYPHRVIRQVKWREPVAYMREALAGRAVSNEEEVGRKALPFEFMLNALRLREGFEMAQFVDRTGLPPSALTAKLEQARAQGLLEAYESSGGPAWRPTVRGFDFLSDLQGLFL
ncbi:radical SAM family heme chaperone HemW [Ideonella sp.]|uniref:radical SAM family heme chaperone HemW n=1 Tax=Ideonella sp. TaxID=1929293 RepID=UPI003BB77EE6